MKLQKTPPKYRNPGPWASNPEAEEPSPGGCRLHRAGDDRNQAEPRGRPSRIRERLPSLSMFGRAISVFSERSFQHSSFKRSRTFLQCFTDFLENIARSASLSSKSLEFREMLVKICEFLTKFVQSLLLLFFLFLFHAMCCKRNLKIVQCFFDIRQNCVEFCEIGTEDLKRGWNIPFFHKIQKRRRRKKRYYVSFSFFAVLFS